MHFRRLEPHEVDLHREVRLRALRDAPEFFADTFTDIAEKPTAYWADLTRSVTEPERQVMILACDGSTVLGSTYGLLDHDRKGMGRVGGMWVDPAWRRRGIARALLQEIFGWARERGFGRLGLWAPAHSAAALALYNRAGFRETGQTRPLPTNPALSIVEMEVPV